MVAVPLLVLGARFSGLATALFLAHQGFPVHVLERDPPVDGDPDVAVLPPHALRELAVLGLADAVCAQAWEPAGSRTPTPGPARCCGSPSSGAPSARGSAAPTSSSRTPRCAPCSSRPARPTRWSPSSTAAPSASVEDLGDAVLVTDDTGGSYRAEAVVGADGPGSRLRGHLGGGHAVSAPYLLHRAPGPAPPDGVLRLWSSPSLHVTHAEVPGGAGTVSVTVRVDALDEMHRDGGRRRRRPAHGGHGAGRPRGGRRGRRDPPAARAAPPRAAAAGRAPPDDRRGRRGAADAAAHGAGRRGRSPRRGGARARLRPRGRPDRARARRVRPRARGPARRHGRPGRTTSPPSATPRGCCDACATGSGAATPSTPRRPSSTPPGGVRSRAGLPVARAVRRPVAGPDRPGAAGPPRDPPGPAGPMAG